MNHDYKYENLREEDRNALIPAFGLAQTGPINVLAEIAKQSSLPVAPETEQECPSCVGGDIEDDRGNVYGCTTCNGWGFIK